MLTSESFLIRHGTDLIRCRGEKRTYILKRDGTEIGSITGWDTTRVEEVAIPNKGIRTIQYGVFDGFGALKTVHIPEGVQEIRGGFENCTALEDIYLPDSLTSLSPYSFPPQATIHVHYKQGDWRRLWAHKHRPLSDLKVPPTAAMVAMDYIRQRRCGKLELHIDAGELENYEFLNCDIPFSTALDGDSNGEIRARYIFQGSQANEVYLGSNVSFIDPLALSSTDVMCSEVSLRAIHVDPSNEVYHSKDGVLFTRDGILLRYPQDKSYVDSEVYVIPEGTTAIYEAAFEGCYFLRKLIIPESLPVDEARLRSQMVDLEEIIYV